MKAARIAAETCPPDAIAEKWRVLDNLRAARHELGLSDRCIGILNALLTYHHDATLSAGDDLIIHPSNRSLSLRANNVADSTLRRHLAALVEAGLIIRRDSPNGKRYARKSSGEGANSREAFGFDLTPLVARAAEFQQIADRVREEAKTRYLLREDISVLRRDIRQSLTMARDEGLEGPWSHYTERFVALGGMPPRNAEVPILEAMKADLAALFADVDKSIEDNIKTENMSANESHSERHQQNTNQNPFLDSEKGIQGNVEKSSGLDNERQHQPSDLFAVKDVVEACPQIQDYSPGGGKIRTWRDLRIAAGHARGSLGISGHAWNEALGVLGEERASVTVAVILQRSDGIRSAGGYLRKLTTLASEGKFSLTPMITALLRARLYGEGKRA
jgi:replication initiation protein RepC